MQVIVNQFAGVSTMDVLPLAAGLLAASAKAHPDLGAQLDLRIGMDRDDPEQVVAGYDGPDAIGFSCYTWNTCYSLEVARLAKRRFPECLTVFGGPSIPRRADSARAFLERHPFADVLVFGEGEIAFREILLARLGGGDLSEVQGIAYRTADADHPMAVTDPRPRLTDFSQTASPFLDGTFDALYEAHGGGLTAAVCETNRGCPFACTFCDWGQATQSRVHELPLERVFGELEWIVARRLPYIYIVDANFGIRPRDVEIVGHLAELKRRTGSPAFCYFHLTKNAHERNLQTVYALREAGIGCQVALSMQDFDPAVLRAVKRANISLERSLRLRRVCNRQGIPTFNELLLGLPEQTYASFRDSVVKAITPYPGDSFFLYLCRLLENAEMASPAHRERYGLQTVRCQVGSAHHPEEPSWVPEHEEVVVATRAMPPEDWRRAYRFGQLLSAFYNLQLLHVVIHALWITWRVDLATWMQHLLAQLRKAGPGTALGRLDAVLERYADAVCEGGTLALPAQGAGSHLWAVGDALLMAALTDPDPFYDEVASATENWLLSSEGSPQAPRLGLRIGPLFAYQRFITPSLERRGIEEARFECDWLGYHERMGFADPNVPESTQVTLKYTPPAYVRAATGPREFALAHLAALHAKTGGSCVRKVGPDPRAVPAHLG